MNLSTICIASQNWTNALPNDAANLMSALSHTEKVIVVNPQPTLKDVFATAFHGPNRLGFRFHASSRLTKIDCNNEGSLYVLQPRPSLPIHWLRNFTTTEQWAQINARRLETDIRRAMLQLGIEQPVIINAGHPTVGLALKGRFNECLLVYYCNQEISSNPHNDQAIQAETEFIEQVDAVIVTSTTLFKTKCAFAKQTYWIPRGINFTFFNTAVGLRTKHQRDYQSWAIRAKKPFRNIVGVVSPVDHYLDVDLLQYCLDAMPDTDFWFIGPIRDKTAEKKLMAWPNAWLLGRQDTAQLPELLAQMNAFILPFVCNSLTHQLDPLFIHEFLAAGLPIISTPFTDLSDFKDSIDVTNNSVTFLQLLDNVLTEPDYGLTFRLAAAYENDWSRRANLLRSVIHEQCTRNQVRSYTKAVRHESLIV